MKYKVLCAITVLSVSPAFAAASLVVPMSGSQPLVIAQAAPVTGAETGAGASGGASGGAAGGASGGAAGGASGAAGVAGHAPDWRASARQQHEESAQWPRVN